MSKFLLGCVGMPNTSRGLTRWIWDPGRPRVGEALAHLRRGQDPLVLDCAWRAQHPLRRRWERMAGRGKPHQRIVVPTARELVGLVWTIATDYSGKATEKPPKNLSRVFATMFRGRERA